jgi:hypothetical protein
MTEESLESKETVTDVTTELDSALKDMGVEVSEEDKKKEKVESKTETEDQKERSNLGRKVKRLEDTLTQILDRLDTISSRSSTERSIVSEDDVPEIISTYDDFSKAFDKKEREKGEAQEKYSKAYVKEFYALRNRDPELYEEIFEEMKTNFDRRFSNDPRMDAMVNYAEAKAALLSKKVAPAKANVKGKKSEVATDVGIESRVTETESRVIKLDPLAEEFAKSQGMTDESIREALSK